jgi:hypothetical protein
MYQLDVRDSPKRHGDHDLFNNGVSLAGRSAGRSPVRWSRG